VRRWYVGRRAFAGLSGALLTTLLVLLAAGLARLPGMATGDPAGVPARPVPLAFAGIEPKAGPAAAPVSVEPSPADESGGTTSRRPVALDGDPDVVAALEQLSAELARYRSALDERERTIAVREAVVQALQARVSEQITRLDALKDELQQVAGQVDADERARIAQLVKVYEAMKAKNAAAIFDPMPIDLLLPIVRGMRETKAAAIVAEMDPGKARALTAVLARAGATPAAQ